MRLTKILLVLMIVLLLATCGAPLSPDLWTEAQRAIIETAIAGVSVVEANNILTDLDMVRHVRVTSGAALLGVEDDILNRLASYGLTTEKVPVTIERVEDWDPVEEENFGVSGSFTMNNLIATRPGTNPDLDPVYVTTHWDTVAQSPGADDNASGCVGLLETARVLQGLTLERTVVFVAFAFEEESLGGSEAYVSSLPPGITPKAVLNLEMIGFTSPVQMALPLTDVLLEFPAVGDFIGVVAADFARQLGFNFCRVANEFVPSLPAYMIGADATLQNNPLLDDFLRSDHTSFLARGIPALMITDTANLREGTPYHTADDIPATLDIPYMINVIKVVAALTALEAGLVP